MATHPTDASPAATQAYSRIAPPLFRRIPWARWWSQFCIAKTRDGLLRYRTSWEFCAKKGRDWNETYQLYAMIGPDSEQADLVCTCAPPRLGDWEQRRLFRFVFGDWSKDLAALESINHGTLSLDALQVVKPKLARLIGLNRRLEQQVDVAFAGQPFWPDSAADSGTNRRRVRAYMRLQGRLGRELCCCAELLVLIHIVNAYFDFLPTTEPKNRARQRETRSTRVHSLKALETLQADVARLFERNARIAEEVDEAFAGQPFRRGQAPTSARNRQRFLLYLRLHWYAQVQVGIYASVWTLIAWVKIYLEPVPTGHRKQREDK